MSGRWEANTATRSAANEKLRSFVERYEDLITVGTLSKEMFLCCLGVVISRLFSGTNRLPLEQINRTGRFRLTTCIVFWNDEILRGV